MNILKLICELDELGYRTEIDSKCIWIIKDTFSLRIDMDKHKIVVREKDKDSLCEISEKILEIVTKLCREVWI